MKKSETKNTQRKMERNTRLYYVMSMAMNCWFIASNWIYFWTKFMTYGQLGWVDALGFGFALLLEIPSGAIADLIGKKRTIQIAFLGGGLGVMMIALTNSLPQLFLGWMISQIAFSFYSGAAEALAYDSLIKVNKEKLFDQVITKGESLAMYIGALTTVIGGFIYQFSFRLPHILWGLCFFLGWIASIFLTEPKVESEKFSIKNYMNQIKEGMKELFAPSIRQFSIFFFILSGIYYMYSWGFIRPAIATSFGFFAKEQAVILVLLTVVGATGLRIIPWLRKRISDYLGLVLLSLLMALSFIIAAFNIGIYGFVVMLMLAIAGEFSRPWLSIIVNDKIPSKYRATTLSTAALINRIPYVLVAITAGKMIEEGKLAQFNIGIGVIVLIGVIASLIYSKYLKTPDKSF